jgi:hypothetical protein
VALNYQNLDGETRRYMAEEINRDIGGGNLYMGGYLTEIGKRDWPDLILNAAETSDDATLSALLSRNGRLMETAFRKKPGGGLTTYKVPYTAPEMLAEGEFNRFYTRGLCRVAIERGIPGLIVYRAKYATNPRAESEAKIGLQVDPRQLLQDLRTSIGVEPALGIPPGPNSGLSVRLP